MSVLELAKALLACPSLTPNEAGTHDLLCLRLKKLGFEIENLPQEGVSNVWARRGKTGPLFVFAGHSDVVPTGPLESWTSAPFEPKLREGKLYGRGAVDMKGALAAMVDAVERFLAKHPDPKASLAFLITSDEEGPSIHGTRHVMEVLGARQEKIDYCLIGEPSSESRIGDQIRVGRRGSLHGNLTILGEQAHIAYPQSGQNPIHHCLQALHELCTTVWDKGNELFPPTTFQISNIHAGTGALNVTPGLVQINFNFRFSPALTLENLRRKVDQILDQQGLRYELKWNLSAEPFMAKRGLLAQKAQEAVLELMGYSAKLSTGGGTSDGRFIAPTGAEVIELGLCHALAHQVDEAVPVKDLEQLSDLYFKLLEKALVL